MEEGDVRSAACIDGTPTQWWDGRETITVLLSVFVRWEIQTGAEALIYRNSVTDFCSRLNLCQAMTQLLTLGLCYLARFRLHFPGNHYSSSFPVLSAPL